MKAEHIVPILNAAAGIAVFLLSVFIKLPMPISGSLGKSLGTALAAAGVALVLWAFLYLRGRITGSIEPKLHSLVQEGPYRFVRHPVYLGWTVALIGVAVVLRSWAGLLSVALLYLPSAIWRAKLEEEALTRRFGRAWEDYRKHTGFLLPRLLRRKR